MNEANADEIVRRVQEPKDHGVMVNSGELPGLDTTKTKPNCDPPRADESRGEDGDLPADGTGNAGTMVRDAAGEATLAGRRLGQAEADRSIGLDGSVLSDAAAGVVGSSGQEWLAGPANARVGAISEDVGELTTLAHAKPTTEAKVADIASTTKRQDLTDVPANSGELSGLDTRQMERRGNTIRMGGGGESAIGMESLEGATPGGCSPLSVTHPP
jgi:hypothetical protein